MRKISKILIKNKNYKNKGKNKDKIMIVLIIFSALNSVF